MGSNEDVKINATKTSFRLIETLGDLEGATLTTLADQLDLPKSTVHRHLSTLLSLGYVVKRDAEYDISYKFLKISESRRSRDERLFAVQRAVYEIAEETSERVVFTVEEKGMGVYLFRAGGVSSYRSDVLVGRHRPLHSTASGKAILSTKSNEEIREYIDTYGLTALTEHTITDPDAFLDDMERTRERGYSLSEEENRTGLRAVGVPVRRPDGAVLGALAVFGPKGRFPDDRFENDLPERLLNKAEEIQIDLEYA
ncbi:MAG: IclR family transcriptional regulator [Halanaeroarchaeum sp.]